jgi:outer membrane protein insertion porin family
MTHLKRYSLLVLFLSLFSFVTAFSEDSQVSYENLRIRKIEVTIGQTQNAAQDKAQESSVRTRMKTREGNFFSQNDFDDDLKVLSQEYDRVEPVLEVDDNKLNIELHLFPKPAIGKIIFIGNKDIKADKLKKELDIREGSTFDRAVFNKAFHKLKNYYIKRGFFEAELDYKVRPNKEAGNVDIEISVNEGRSGVIKKIEFKGVSKREREALEELIYTKEYNLFTSWMTNEGTLREDVLRQDELSVLNYLHNKGYADAKVKVTIEKAKDKDRVIIVFTCKKGDKYYLGNITFSGNKLFSNDVVQKAITLKQGDVYSPEAVRNATQALLDAYGRKGYIDSLVTADPKLIPGKKAYDLHLTIEEGGRFRVGLIKVFGNTRTDASVILHETLLVPGEIFDTALLNKTEEKLRNIGYFENVNVYAVRSKQEQTGSTNFRDVHIDVEEKPSTGSFRASVAYSRDEGVVGTVGIAENNFRILGTPYIFSQGIKAIRGGGEYLGFNVMVGSQQLSYNLGWSKPYFLDTPWTVGVDFQKMRNQYASSDYTVKAYSGEVFGRYPINAFLTYGLNYRLRHSFITLKTHHHHNRKLIRESRNDGLISSVGSQLFYNSTNHPVLPRQGLKSQLSAEYAGLGGDHTFLRFNYLNTLFVEAYSKGLFIFKGSTQFIQTLGHTDPKDIPLDERLYAGGEHTIRGYAFNRVGPKFNDKARTVRGGMSEVLLSAEYDQYIFKKLDAFVFFDAGNVYFKEFKIGNLKASAGYGIRLKVFESAPPVTIGIGYPIKPGPHKKEDLKRFFISFGTSY